MVRQPRKPGTWDDLDAVPEGSVGEIVAGEILVHPRPDPPHVMAASSLGALLTMWFGHGIGGPGGWVILDEPRVRFGDDIRVPDLAGWRRERFVAVARGPLGVVPDWICELLSPGTAALDRSEKLPLYARHRVGHVWLLDPIARTLEVFRLQGEGWYLAGVWQGDATVRAEPFDVLDLDLSLVWGKGESPPG